MNRLNVFSRKAVNAVRNIFQKKEKPVLERMKDENPFQSPKRKQKKYRPITRIVTKKGRIINRDANLVSPKRTREFTQC